MFPISRDPPEGGTCRDQWPVHYCDSRFQFLGIPPKGEQAVVKSLVAELRRFPISRDPPEGGTWALIQPLVGVVMFPISRDPPEGGTWAAVQTCVVTQKFPISRDPPEGGTSKSWKISKISRGLFPISRDPPEGGTRD